MKIKDVIKMPEPKVVPEYVDTTGWDNKGDIANANTALNEALVYNSLLSDIGNMEISMLSREEVRAIIYMELDHEDTYKDLDIVENQSAKNCFNAISKICSDEICSPTAKPVSCDVEELCVKNCLGDGQTCACNDCITPVKEELDEKEIYKTIEKLYMGSPKEIKEVARAICAKFAVPTKPKEDIYCDSCLTFMDTKKDFQKQELEFNEVCQVIRDNCLSPDGKLDGISDIAKTVCIHFFSTAVSVPSEEELAIMLKGIDSSDHHEHGPWGYKEKAHLLRYLLTNKKEA
jgi:hypothetical protein